MPRFFLFLLSLYSCVGYAFAHYTQVFSLLSMSSYKSKLFVFFLSSVLLLTEFFHCPKLCLASFQLCLPGEISAFLMTSIFFCCTTTEVQSSTGCSHDNSLSSMQLMLGTLVPCQCINKLICILGVSRQAYDEECWLTQTIIDFLKGFLENTIQVMWLVWTRQSPFELAP